MGDNPSRFRRDGGYGYAVGGLSTANFPVDSVSWQQAGDFCRKLSEKSARFVYRLPTDEEWEHACRGGGITTTAFHVGARLDSTQANFNGSGAGGPGLKRPCAVGHYTPNALGLYDMHGNVFEWCSDDFDGSGRYRAVRGGCWSNAHSGSCSAAERGGHDPVSPRATQGFRVAADPVPGGAAA
jgi:formylglycine-generating enzyme required for sulfatase activity